MNLCLFALHKKGKWRWVINYSDVIAGKEGLYRKERRTRSAGRNIFVGYSVPLKGIVKGAREET